MDRLTIEIIGLYDSEPELKLNINQIAKKLSRTYPFVHKRVGQMVGEGILNRSVFGKSGVISLNLKNDKTKSLLSLYSVSKREGLNKRVANILNEFVERVKENPSVKSIVLFGSYAKGSATEKSDIDIMVIASEKTSKITNLVKNEASSIRMEYSIELVPIVVDVAIFKNMLKRKHELNVGRESLRNHIILYGYDDFWNMVSDVSE